MYSAHQSHHRVFLLRCWQENSDLANHRLHWRFLIESISPQRERRGFIALDDLLAFLRQEFESPPDEDAGESWPND